MRKRALAAVPLVSLLFAGMAQAQSLDLRPSLPSGATQATTLTTATTMSNVWTTDIEVTQIGTYADASWHFVWFTSIPTACSSVTPFVMGFDEAAPGGKALLATLTTALVSKRKVSLQSNGCRIYEVYLR